MTADDIRRYIVAVPFQPFTLNTADGRQISVVARDFIMLSPIGRSVTVYQLNGTHDLLDTRLLVGVTVIVAPTPAGSPDANGSNP